MKLPELLSPAGGMDQLKAAVENGADAVYMGGKLFNARRNAANFSADDMRQAIEYAHIRGVNIYITMNTLISDSEMPQAADAAVEAYMAGADALIVQDLGFAALLRRCIPDFPLHISTQGTVYSAEGIRALAPLGFSRVILARELSLSEISHIAQESPIPVEVFAHGALCVCYSGQCLMSSMIGSRSGNRGQCAQPCRLPYALGGEKGYLLSPKDICTVGLLPQLVQVGVAALKIEGRMKSAEYVAVVTGIYRKYLDRIAEGGPNAVEAEDRRDLLQIFNRGGFTTGYLEGRQGRAFICRERPKHWGVPLGKVVARKAQGVLDVQLSGRVALGDGVEVITPTLPGGIVTFLRVNDSKCDEAGPGRASLGYIDGAAKPGDEIVKTSDKALNERARASFEGRPRRKVPVSGELCVRAGELMRLAVSDGDGNRARAESAAPAERADTKPISSEAALAQLRKTGDSPFEMENCRIDVDGEAAAKLSELNALRREALGKLEGMRTRRYAGRAMPQMEVPQSFDAAKPAVPRLAVFLWRWRDDLAEILRLADRIYAPFEAVIGGKAGAAARPAEWMAWLPPVSSGNLDARVREKAGNFAGMGLDGVLAGSAAQFEMLKDNGVPVYADAGLNVFNSLSLRQYSEMGFKGVTLSHELTLRQIEALSGCGIEMEAAVYGRLALMTSAHCPVGAEVAKAGGKPCGLCRRNAAHTLTDRTGAKFPVLCDALSCRSVLLNADVLAVPEIVPRLLRAGVSTLRVYLYDESPGEAEKVLNAFRLAIDGQCGDEFKGKGFTKGHYFREV